MRDQAEGLKKDAKLISIVSGKGGVGKSLVAVNLSIAVAKTGKKVLLFDADIGFGNAEVLLGITTKKTLKDYFQKSASLDEIIITTEYGVDLLSSGLDVEDLVYFNIGDRERLFKDFTRVINKYDYIIMDFPPGYNENLENFYSASDYLVVVTTPEPTSLINCYTFLKMTMIKGIEPDEIHLLLNMVKDMREGRRILERFLGVIERFIGISITATHVMKEDVNVKKSVEQQEPFIVKKQSIQPSLVMFRVANFITQTKPKVQKSSFIERLKKFLGIS